MSGLGGGTYTNMKEKDWIERQRAIFTKKPTLEGIPIIGKIWPDPTDVPISLKRGGVKFPGGGTFWMGTAPDGTPMIRHKETDQHWTVEWSELIDIAIKCGLTNPPEKD